MSSSLLNKLPQLFNRHRGVLLPMYHAMAIRTNRHYILKRLFNKLNDVLVFVLKNRFLVMDLDVSLSPLAISASFPVGFRRSTKSNFNLDVVIPGSRLMKYKAGN